MTGRCRAGVGALVVLLALPGIAEAKTKSVNLGIPPSAGKAFEQLGLPLDVNDFFPHGVTINRGDKIRFLPVGFHSFDLPARGGDMLPLISPTGEKVAGVNDAANQPFWFNGQDQVGFTARARRRARSARSSPTTAPSAWRAACRSARSSSRSR